MSHSQNSPSPRLPPFPVPLCVFRTVGAAAAAAVPGFGEVRGGLRVAAAAGLSGAVSAGRASHRQGGIPLGGEELGEQRWRKAWENPGKMMVLCGF